jgi:hypothetical protein
VVLKVHARHMGRIHGRTRPHVSTLGASVQTLRALAGEVDRAVSMAIRVREEVEPALSGVQDLSVPPATSDPKKT